jgi:hypothetical protein
LRGETTTAGAATPEWQREVGTVQALFRDVNERAVALALDGDDRFIILCECGDDACIDHLEVDRDAYDAVRNDPRRFFVKPGHDIPEAEHVVSSADGLAIVEKVGAAAAVALRRDGGAATKSGPEGSPASSHGRIDP